MTTESWLTICGMALVTYVTRAGGLWLMGRIQPSPRVTRWLRQLPGAVLVSIVAPMVLTTGPAELAAVLVTGAAALRTGSVLIAMLLGVGTVWAMRQFI